jgi:hypothetical protein
MKLRQAAALASAFLLYSFSGAGVYWLFLGWFHNADVAGFAGLFIPLPLLWLLSSGWLAD